MSGFGRTAVLFVLVTGCVTGPREGANEDRNACEGLAEYCSTADAVWKRWGNVRISCIHRESVDENGLVDRLRLFGLKVILDPEAVDDDEHAGVHDLPADQYLRLHLAGRKWACLVTETGEIAVFPPERRSHYETSTILEADELAEALRDVSGERRDEDDERNSNARDLRRLETKELLQSRVQLSGDLALRDAFAALAAALGKRLRVSPALWRDASRVVLDSHERPASEILVEFDSRTRWELAVILRGDVLWFVERP